MESGKQNLTIDVEQVIASKSRKLAKYTPEFIINSVKRIIHQDEINHILENNRNKTGVDFASASLKDMNVAYNVIYTNKDSIQKAGRYIFVSNHPLGGLDGLILISLLGKELGEVKFVVNDLLMNIKPLETIFVPVNKHGHMSKEYGGLINNAYASECHILYFPAGLCSRMINGKITDPPWQKNFLRQALKYNRDIVPVYFGGRNSTFFYRLAQLRKRLGIKFNIEMILLPREMFRRKNSIFDVVIGEPVPAAGIRESMTGSKELEQWSKLIRDKTYALRQYIKKNK